MLEKIHSSFPDIFVSKDEETTESGEEENTSGNEDDGENNTFSVFPLIMLCAKESCTPVMFVFDWPIGMLFYTSTFIMMQNRKKEEALRKIKPRG